uniref:Uncharacterized protein n=1 Tax=Strigamia maritima TaxID=126957 RepID=T1JAA4_STRMM
MEKLRAMSLEILCNCIFQWRIEEVNEDVEKTTVELIHYFEKLPGIIREEILINFILRGFWDGQGHRVPEARHIALFLHEEQKLLLMEFYSENFDLEFLLKVNGHKLKNLIELQLPDQSSLTANVCEEMCQLMPNLKQLDLSGCFVEDDAMIYIAKLPLVALDPGESIMEQGVKQLCKEDSTARNTLRVLKLGNSGISVDCYCLILRTMKLIEDMDCFYSTWLNTLSPIDLRRQQYNIRKLVFHYSLDAIEDELEIGVVTCPKVSKIDITSNIFTPKMLRTLTKFKELNTLNISVSSNSDVNIEDENQLFDRLCLGNLYFHNLIEFSLCDRKDGWISSGYLFAILEMCPNLEKLRLFQCDGFSNKIAGELAKLMAKKKLKHLMIDYCDLLGPSGIEDLLKITSLIELEVNLFITEIKKQHFDAHPMQQTAEKHGVNLQLNILVDQFIWFY